MWGFHCAAVTRGAMSVLKTVPVTSVRRASERARSRRDGFQQTAARRGARTTAYTLSSGANPFTSVRRARRSATSSAARRSQATSGEVLSTAQGGRARALSHTRPRSATGLGPGARTAGTCLRDKGGGTPQGTHGGAHSPRSRRGAAAARGRRAGPAPWPGAAMRAAGPGEAPRARPPCCFPPASRPPRRPRPPQPPFRPRPPQPPRQPAGKGRGRSVTGEGRGLARKRRCAACGHVLGWVARDDGASGLAARLASALLSTSLGPGLPLTEDRLPSRAQAALRWRRTSPALARLAPRGGSSPSIGLASRPFPSHPQPLLRIHTSQIRVSWQL